MADVGELRCALNSSTYRSFAKPSFMVTVIVLHEGTRYTSASIAQQYSGFANDFGGNPQVSGRVKKGKEDNNLSVE